VISAERPHSIIDKKPPQTDAIEDEAVDSVISGHKTRMVLGSRLPAADRLKRAPCKLAVNRFRGVPVKPKRPTSQNR